MDIVTPIPAATGSQVAILGTSNYWLNSAGVTSSTTSWFVSTTNAWLEQGGIVLVSQEPITPWSSGEPDTDTYTPGTNANNNWNAYLQAQAAMFKQLSGAVMWRPFPEANGGDHFGSTFTPAQFQLLWQYTYNYMKSQGVNNILWVFNVNDWDHMNSGSTYYSGSLWYPGSAYVDIVSMDAYPPGQGAWDTVVYNWMVSTGKPFMFAESGPNGSGAAGGNNDTGVLDVIKSKFPKTFAVMIWCQGWALPKQDGESAFMTDPAIITLSDVPAALKNGLSTSP
jgi:beta-mannanase